MTKAQALQIEQNFKQQQLQQNNLRSSQVRSQMPT